MARLPLWSPPKAGRKFLKRKSSWHRRRRSKILAVSLKHWKGRMGGGGRRGFKGREVGGGGQGRYPPPPPTVYGRSNTSLPFPASCPGRVATLPSRPSHPLHRAGVLRAPSACCTALRRAVPCRAVPCLWAAVPPKSSWIAPTQRHRTAERSGKEGRCTVLQATPPTASVTNSNRHNRWANPIATVPSTALWARCPSDRSRCSLARG